MHKYKKLFIAALLNRAVTYFHGKEYDKSWEGLRRIEKLGAGELIDPAFREALEKRS